MKKAATEYPNRQSLRLRGWDYRSPGWYFVTINTRKKRPLFGTLVNRNVAVSELGRIVEKCWLAIPEHFPSVVLDEMVIMPDHMHGLLELRAVSAGQKSPTLGDVVGAYKSAVSREWGRRKGRQLPAHAGRQLPTRPLPVGASPVWHRNYWDVIVHDTAALENIRRYIRDNPVNAPEVVTAAEPRTWGDRRLLERLKIGFLASRGEKSPHGVLPIRAGEVILSGFLSPMERTLFLAGLRDGKAMIWVKPWGLNAEKESPRVREAVEAGTLLVMSPFDEKLDAPAARRAAWCNQFVTDHSERIVIGHLNPAGMLACVISELDPEKKVTLLS
jgi:REP element-mobilizing transposase RayT